MEYPKSILRGYDKVGQKAVASSLGISLPKKRKVKHRMFQLKHVRRMKHENSHEHTY